MYVKPKKNSKSFKEKYVFEFCIINHSLFNHKSLVNPQAWFPGRDNKNTDRHCDL